jgi:NAD(P)-dependent dehydrogenase (short-subunit alcohol dehydrogenase family)
MSRVVVVTGGSAGVGRAVVRALARRGDSVGILARGAHGLTGAGNEVKDAGSSAIVVPTDVADHEQVERAASQVEERLGPIDVWINCAMTSVFAPFKDMSPADFRRVTEVTYLGYVYGTMSALRRMLARGKGTIVQVGSALAFRGIPLQSAYCGSKHAITGFMDSLRAELLHDKVNVHVTEVHLPALNTPQFDWVKSLLPKRAQPVPPIYQPEVAARAVLWAADHPERRSYSVGTTTAATILADKFVPGLLERYLARTGYDSQQTEEPEDPARPHNLLEPVPQDHGARGRFSDRSHERNPQFWLSAHRRWVGLAGGMLGLALLAARRRAGD